MPQAPDEVQVEFGLDLHAEVGAIIAAANFKTAMTWRRTQPPSIHADWFPVTTTVGEMTG